MKYFYDTEFLEDGHTIKLISIGIVAEDGREYYAVNSDMPIERIREHKWLCENVVPHLPLHGNGIQRSSFGNYLFNLDIKSAFVKPKWVVANEVRDFLLASTPPQLWAWYSAYDHVALAQLFGIMLNMPGGIPMYTNDVRSLVDFTGIDKLPRQEGIEHHALNDAFHVKTMYEHIMREVAR